MHSKSRRNQRQTRRRKQHTRKRRGGFLSMFKPKTRAQLEQEAQAAIAKKNPSVVQNDRNHLQHYIRIEKVNDILSKISYLKTLSTTPSLPISKANSDMNVYKQLRNTIASFAQSYSLPFTSDLIDTYTVADIDTLYQNMLQYTNYNQRAQQQAQNQVQYALQMVKKYASNLPDDTTTISQYEESVGKPGSMGTSLVLSGVNQEIKNLASAYQIPLRTSPINLTKPDLNTILSKIPG
jgi:hypothetical protein